MSKISDATTVTEDNGLVLGAREKNAALDGTIMNNLIRLEEKGMWKVTDFSESSNVKEESGKRIVTYNIDLSGKNELLMNIYARSYSPMFFKVFPLTTNGMIESLYVIDNHGYTWSGHVSASIKNNEVSFHTYKNSTNIDINYFQLVTAWTR